jgi:hypothetical protein
VRAKTKVAESVVATRLINSRDVAIKFYLEPWGEEYEMPPGAVFHVVARGPEGDALEVAIADEQITVWGWPESVVTLFHEGAELGAGRWERSRVPAMPPLEETAVPPMLLDRSIG